MADLATGNIAWLTMLGYIMPPQIGLFFVLIKPQLEELSQYFGWSKHGEKAASRKSSKRSYR